MTAPLDDFELPDDEEARALITSAAPAIGRYRIEDDSAATWAMRKARSARQRLDDIDRIAAAEVDRIQTWALTERRSPERDLAFFAFLLEEYALHVREQDPQRKSVVTPYGTVQTRTSPARWVIDEAVFLAWAKENRPDLVKTVDSPKLAEAKKALSVDGATVHDAGTVVPGVTVHPAGLAATVNPETS